MAVDDHGLEVLKKSGEEVTPGDKSDYYIKTRNTNSFDDIVVLASGSSLNSAFDSISIDVSAYTMGALRASWENADADNEATFVIEASTDDVEWQQIGESGVALVEEDGVQIWQFLEIPSNYIRLIYTDNGNSSGSVDIDFVGKF